MSGEMELAAIYGLAGFAALCAAAAGAFWGRSRSMHIVHAARLARELSERLRTLDAVLERLDALTSARPAAQVETAAPSVPIPLGPRAMTAQRIDAAQASAVAEPTLIAVPDLAVPTHEPGAVAAELARRFGAIWELAEGGASADEIARATGHPVGQVQLILGLRRQLAATGARP